jgi:DNA-binding NarL/FixJ family response regulator
METSKKILCIEDDQEIADLIGDQLGDCGFDVTTARDGEEGLRAISRNVPDLVLCDIKLPKESGFRVLEHLTAIAPQYGRTPFIFLTAMVDREIELKARQLGADDYVTKPIDFDMLEIIIKTRLANVGRTATHPNSANLSDRESELLTRVARGKTSSEIAGILGMSKRTVDFHLDNARRKLDATTRTQAAIKAAMEQLIEP